MPNALSRRDGEFCLYTGAAATGDEVGSLRSSLARLHEAMAPCGTGGACLNFLAGPDVTSEQIRSAFLPSDLTRLDDIKRQVDPTNIFRTSQSMGPAR